jgi:hypothetical protein
MTHRLVTIMAIGLAGLVPLVPYPASAQLKDETPAERDAQILRAMVAGNYSNGEQVYFDERLALPPQDRAPALSVRFELVLLTGSNEQAVKVTRATNTVFYLLKLDRGALAVRWAAHTLRSGADPRAPASSDLVADPRCDLISRREAGQFRAAGTGTCVDGPAELMIAERTIWWRSSFAAAPARLNRARAFDCYVDMPGSGGIMGESFHRFDGLKVDDQGTEAWFTTKEAAPRRLGLRLRSVDWAMNNKAGTYTRDSLTLYLFEANGAEPPRNITYAFTDPNVRRIGLNTIAILANCYMDAPSSAKPEF